MSLWDKTQSPRGMLPLVTGAVRSQHIIKNNITTDKIEKKIIKIHREGLIGLAGYGVKNSVRTLIGCTIYVLTAPPERFLIAHIHLHPLLFI